MRHACTRCTRVWLPTKVLARAGSNSFHFHDLDCALQPSLEFSWSQREARMPLLGEVFPNFTADTTIGTISFHDFVGDGWVCARVSQCANKQEWSRAVDTLVACYTCCKARYHKPIAGGPTGWSRCRLYWQCQNDFSLEGVYFLLKICLLLLLYTSSSKYMYCNNKSGMVCFVPSHSAGQSCSPILLTTLLCVRLSWERWPDSFQSLRRGTQRSLLFPVMTWRHTRDGLRTLRYCSTSW